MSSAARDADFVTGPVAVSTARSRPRRPKRQGGSRAAPGTVVEPHVRSTVGPIRADPGRLVTVIDDDRSGRVPVGIEVGRVKLRRVGQDDGRP